MQQAESVINCEMNFIFSQNRVKILNENINKSLENTLHKINIALRLTDIKYDFAYHGNVVSEYRLHYHIVSILSTLLN